jgi:hypothetical protein
MMKERKVPVPIYHPCADNDNNEEPVKRLSHIRGRAKRRGKKSLMSVQVFIEHY